MALRGAGTAGTATLMDQDACARSPLTALEG